VFSEIGSNVVGIGGSVTAEMVSERGAGKVGIVVGGKDCSVAAARGTVGGGGPMKGEIGSAADGWSQEGRGERWGVV